MDLQAAARALGGEVRGGEILAPGPNHSPADRSLAVKVDAAAPGGIFPLKMRMREGWSATLRSRP